MDPKHFTVGPRGNLGAHTCHNTSHLHPPPGPWPQGCAPLTPTCRYTPIHMHADRHRKMTTENVRPIDAAGGHRAQEHARWCRLRLRLRPGGRHGRCGCACRRVGATVRCCRAHTGRDRGQEKQAERENEAEMRRVRSPRAAAHLRRLLCHRPVGCGGGGARPPTH